MDDPAADGPVTISIAAQLDPVWKVDRAGEGGPPDLKLYTEQLTAYLAQNLERFADPRGGDVFVAVCVTRDGETVAHEYRSGHFVKAAVVSAAERPPHGWDEIPEGHEVVAVEEGPEWRVEKGDRSCSRTGGPPTRHQPCDRAAVLALQRGAKRKSWWRYCPEHSYGRWVEDGKVMNWILREIG